MSLFLIFIFTTVRILVLILAIILGYYFVNKIIEPHVLKPECLTDTNSCASMTIWKYKNSFVAQVFPSELYIFFNGARLYVYGQAPGTCTETSESNEYVPVDVITINGTDDNPIYSRQNYECINNVESVVNYYTRVLNVSPITIYIRGSLDTKSANLNVFDLFQRLVDEKIISVNNIKQASS